MYVKLVREGNVVGLTECTHIQVTHYPSLDSPTRKAVDRETGVLPFSLSQVGIEIECCGTTDGEGVYYRIPRDGESLYVTNTGGGTVHAYHVDKEGRAISGEQARRSHQTAPVTTV